MRLDVDRTRDLRLPLTSDGLALELGGALEPSPPVLVRAIRRLARWLHAHLARRLAFRLGVA